MAFVRWTSYLLGLVVTLLVVGDLIDNRASWIVTWYLVDHPEAVVTALLVLLAIGQYSLVSERALLLQQRENYLRLEFESVALFRYCSENPAVPSYLEGQGDATDELTDRSAFWFVSHSLSLFEIFVSFRRKEMVSREIFATWIPWFYELGTAARFPKYWDELSFHYLGELGAIMDKSIGREPLDHLLATGNLEPLQQFYAAVAKIMNDGDLERHFAECDRRWRARLLAKGAAPAI